MTPPFLGVPCPLCDNVPKEPILHQEGDYLVVAAKNLKGHVFRVMVASSRHLNPRALPPGYEEEGVRIIREFAKRYHGLDKGFAVYKDRYSSVPDHWHMICADLLPGEDHDQVLATPRLVFTREHPEGLDVEPEPGKFTSPA